MSGKKQKHDYVFIRIWGAIMGSYQYYIDDQIVLANNSNAPWDAISKNDDDSWSTLADVISPTTQRQIEIIAAQRYPNRSFDFPWKGGENGND